MKRTLPKLLDCLGSKICRVALAICLLLFAGASISIAAQAAGQGSAASVPDLVRGAWPARWITHPGAFRQYGVYHFRRSFQLAAKPAHFVVHLSADNRYALYVNGVEASRGPAAGDLWHWRYETVDLAPQLHAGENTLAVVVWNMAQFAPSFQLTSQTALLVQGDDVASSVANSNVEWKSTEDKAYAPLDRRKSGYPAGELFGAGESVDGRLYPWGWERNSFDDSGWSRAEVVGTPLPRGVRTDFARWFLVPDTLPPMASEPERFARVARAEGVTQGDGLVAGKVPVTVAAHRRAVILLDMGRETTGFPELRVSDGKGAQIEIVYTEALRTPVAGKQPGNWPKGNRDEIEGKEALGMADRFTADGGEHRLYRPLWWRVFRYVQLTVEAADAPVTIEDIRDVRSNYPYVERARFESSDKRLEKIWEVGWRTALNSSHEYFTDGPYYESLQYAGDMRVMALVTLAATGDDRLMRNALKQFDDSRLPDGLTYSRYPSADAQVIPPYSLVWVDAVHDYWRYRADSAFVRDRLPGVRAVLGWFERQVQPSGLPGPLGWWPFVDWVDGWTEGMPPGETEGDSSVLALEWAGALRDAAEMERAVGDPAEAARDERLRARLIEAVRRRYWDEKRGLVADTSAHTSYSQHATILGVLEDVVPAERQTEAMRKVLTDAMLSKPTLYFRFYQGRALAKAGLGNEYLGTLSAWFDMLKLGLTTWPETPDEPRSDCHGWSTSPNYELLTTVAGIEPGSAGFRTVRIEPHLGALAWVKAAMPHERGEIRVEFEQAQGKLKGLVVLPEGIGGVFVEQGRETSLHSGENRIGN